MTPTRGSAPLGALLVVAAAALWGTSGAAQELAVPTASPVSVAAVRVLVGGALLVLVAAWRAGPAELARGWRRAPGAMGAAAVAMGVFQVGYLGGIRLTGVAVGTLVAIGSAPVTAGIIDTVRGRPPGLRWVVATAVTLCGTALLIVPGGGDGARPAGVALALAAGAAYASYAVASKRLLEAQIPATSAVAVTFAATGALLAPTLLLTEVGWVTTTQGLVATAWLGVGTITVGYLLFVRGLGRVEAATATTLTLAEPLTAALLAVVVVGEHLTGTALAGAVLVALGLVGAGHGRRTPV